MMADLIPYIGDDTMNYKTKIFKITYFAIVVLFILDFLASLDIKAKILSILST
jgi:hypothetical protein